MSDGTMKPVVLAFDFDGVIAASLDTCVTACRAVACEMGQAGIPPDNPFAELEPVTFETLAQAYDLEPVSFSARVTRRLETQTECAPIVPGMRGLFEEFSAQADIHILSASSSTVIRQFLEQHCLCKHVTAVHGRDIPGTKAEKLLLMKKTSDVRAMIGDATSDIDAAKKAGVVAVGVAWGWQSGARLLAQGASAVADSPESLSEILRSLACVPCAE